MYVSQVGVVLNAVPGFSDLECTLEERVTTQTAPLLCHTFLVCKILPRFLTYFIPQGLSLPWSGENVLEAV